MKVVTFGELLLRLSTPNRRRFVQAEDYEATFGGAEANVAVALVGFGLESCFISKVPAHDLGQAAVNHLRRFGVGDEHVARGGERLGLYFLETGAGHRASRVIYDRQGSAFTTLQADELDLHRIFDGARWFHFTGITPALGEVPRATLLTLCKQAREAGATVSCDLNYRRTLWTEDRAQEVMIPLMEQVDLLIADPTAARVCLGVTPEETPDEDSAVTLARALLERFDLQTVVVPLRESVSAARSALGAVLLDADCTEPYRSRWHELDEVDPVGAGDALAAGLIYGLLIGSSPSEALEFAVAAAYLKQTIPGDFNLVSTKEIEQLATGARRPRIER